MGSSHSGPIIDPVELEVYRRVMTERDPSKVSAQLEADFNEHLTKARGNTSLMWLAIQKDFSSLETQKINDARYLVTMELANEAVAQMGKKDAPDAMNIVVCREVIRRIVTENERESMNEVNAILKKHYEKKDGMQDLWKDYEKKYQVDASEMMMDVRKYFGIKDSE